LFYTPEPLAPKDVEGEGEDPRRDYILRTVEMVLFPELMRRFIAVKALIHEKRVVEVADLPGLYRIFERC
jgi:DNA mismatch repair protein MLH1